jgi:CheY-like chemotaxis protein
MRVLIAEDEPRLAEALARGLRRNGFAVDIALDGNQALRRTAVVDYDVVVLDRDLPTSTATRSAASSWAPSAPRGSSCSPRRRMSARASRGSTSAPTTT